MSINLPYKKKYQNHKLAKYAKHLKNITRW